MAKIPTSAIGVDLGRHSIKSVLLQRRGSNRFLLTNYAVQPRGEAVETPDELANQLKQLFKQMGGNSKTCAVAVSRADSFLRIIEQPETPPDLLRDALRLNGMALLNQDCRDFVLDCDLIEGSENGGAPAGQQRKYLVGGLPRVRITEINEAFQKAAFPLSAVQLGSVSSFNAFEFAHEQTFVNEAFMLVDIGHVASTVTVGVKKELILVRSIEYGGKALMESLTSHGLTEESALSALEAGDKTAIETTRLSLAGLTREISSSIGFFEGRREENISKIYVSGGAVRSKAILQVLSSELHIPCEAWDPFGKCEITLSAPRKQALAADLPNLNVACGVAAEMLKGN